MSYGVPYKGSKNLIAEKIVNVIPSAENFYDMFAGGCAITHCAAMSGKWENFVCNDLYDDGIRLFRDAVAGKFKDEKRWISRDDFYRLKDADPYVKFCWSFGNNGKSYIYGKDVEPLKKLLHEFVFGDDGPLSDFLNTKLDCRAESPSDRFLWIKHFCKKKSSKIVLESSQGLQGLERPESLESLQCLERLQSMERLQGLQCLQGLQGLERLLDRFSFFNEDYSRIQIKSNSVVYCDIPYSGTDPYFSDFDYDKFYDWASKNENPIFVSEYKMPDIFHLVFSTIKRCTYASNNNSLKKNENLYSNDAGFALLKKENLFFEMKND